MRNRRRRPGYTLLEILLALTIAVMLLAAVYTFVGYQLKQAQAGRELIEQTTLVQRRGDGTHGRPSRHFECGALRECRHRRLQPSIRPPQPAADGQCAEHQD